MFPPQLPNLFIRWMTEPGDTVYDPFCGRGTVPLEAVLTGRRALASDANPLATALTAPKVRIPSDASIKRRITQLESMFSRPDLGCVSDQIRMLYARGTLEQIVFLRGALKRENLTDAFLVAVLLGLLHGNHSKTGATRGLSISMPNTFAMSPGYVRSYIAQHRLEAPEVDVFQMLRKRVGTLGLPGNAIRSGEVWLQDATAPLPVRDRQEKAKLIFTSPPYLQVIKYGKYNWVRLWFLGAEPKEVDERLTDTASLERYQAFMRATLDGLSGALDEEGYACLVIGDVRRGETTINLANEVWKTVAKPAGWQLHGMVSDRVPVGQKVSRIWKTNPGRATKVDRILILSRGASETLPALRSVHWKQPTWQAAVSTERTS